MSKNIEIIIGMKFYPFLIIKGTLLRLTDNKLKVMFDKKYKVDLVKYFPKPIAIRYKKNDKINTIGEGNIVDIHDVENKNTIMAEILIETHTIHNIEDIHI